MENMDVLVKLRPKEDFSVLFVDEHYNWIL